MTTTNPDITIGLYDLRELYLQDRVFTTTPMNRAATVALTGPARTLLAQIGEAIGQDGIAAFTGGGRVPPAIFVMVESPLFGTPCPASATIDKLRSLFAFFEEELEPTLALA